MWSGKTSQYNSKKIMLLGVKSIKYIFLSVTTMQGPRKDGPEPQSCMRCIQSCKPYEIITGIQQHAVCISACTVDYGLVHDKM